MPIVTTNTENKSELLHGSFSAREVAAMLAVELAARRNTKLPTNVAINLQWAPGNSAVVVTVSEGIE